MSNDIIIKPDYRGVKMISYILIIGAVIAGIVGYGHIQDDKLEDLPDGQVEIIIATPNSHGDDISIEDYQAYHDELRSNGAYQLLGYSLVCGMSLVLIGAVLIRLFRKEGVYVATTGATISLIGGVIANLRFQSAANEYLEGALVSNTTLMTYVCGSMMGMCTLLAALPLVNAGARLTLKPKKTDEEE